MQDWFEWNGRRCTEFGIHVSEQPPITIPKERIQQVTIPGRPGTLTIAEGQDVYEDMTLTVTCFITDSSRIPDIAAWLRGSGKVTFATRPGGFYYARVSEQIGFERILRGNPHRSFTVTFLCKPFWYDANAEDILITTQSYLVDNPGSVFSEPVITVAGYGEINLMVNDATVYLDNVSGQVVIDCEAGIAYGFDSGGNKVFAGEQVKLEEGVWPRLEPAGTANLISWATVGGSSRVDYVRIRPNWRYL